MKLRWIAFALAKNWKDCALPKRPCKKTMCLVLLWPSMTSAMRFTGSLLPRSMKEVLLTIADWATVVLNCLFNWGLCCAYLVRLAAPNACGNLDENMLVCEIFALLLFDWREKGGGLLCFAVPLRSDDFKLSLIRCLIRKTVNIKKHSLENPRGTS